MTTATTTGPASAAAVPGLGAPPRLHARRGGQAAAAEREHREPAAAPRRPALVRDEAREPGVQAGRLAPASPLPPCLQGRLLARVLRPAGIGQHPAGEPVAA